jgi:hypothetical protein
MSSTRSERDVPSRFLIVGVQRSGTTVTHTTLSGHPNVAMPHDEVRSDPFFTRGRSVFTWGKESFVERCIHYERLFDFLAHAPDVVNVAARGFKVAVSDSQSAIDIANCVRDYLPDVRIVLVTRGDLVAQFGSLKRAEASGEWHLWEGAKARHGGPKVSIDAEHFAQYVREVRIANAQLRALGNTHALLELHYERDIAPGIDAANLFRFLGLSQVPVTWTVVGKVAPPPRDYIDDYDALVALEQRLPEPTAAELELAARERRDADALRETATFLGHRAWHRVARGMVDDAARDLGLAIQKRLETPMDVSLQGYVRGAFEAQPAAAGRPDVAEWLAVIDGETGHVPRFRISLAQMRNAGGAFRPAYDDMRDLLGRTGDLSVPELEAAFQALHESVVGLRDEALAQATLTELAPRHGASEPHVVLDARMQVRLGRSRAALERLRAHLARHPEASAVARLIDELEGAPASKQA